MKIGDVEGLTGVVAAAIRYWEDRSLINSTRTDNKYCNYTKGDVDLIIKIKQFREIGIPVADIKLWVDNLISTKKLLTEHLKVLDLNADKNEKNRYFKSIYPIGNLIFFHFFKFFQSLIERTNGSTAENSHTATNRNNFNQNKQQTRTFHRLVKGSGLNALVHLTGIEPARSCLH